MPDELKLNTAQHDRVLMISSTDDKTGATGLTLTITACKAGATTLTAIAPTVVEIGAGWYDLAFTAAHTDTLGALSVHITAAGADDNDVDYVVKQYTSDDLAALIDTLLGTPAGASVSADIAAVLSKTPDSAHFTNARGDRLDDLDAAISSRLAGSGYMAPDNTSIGAILTDAGAILSAIGALPAAPSASTNATTLLDDADAIETGLTLRGALRLIAAAIVGNTSGMDTGSIAIRNAAANSKIRIVATGDANGNRTVTSTDAT